MAALNDRAQVQEQYKTSANLNTRISIHQKYSVNKQGFGNWIFSQYRFRENDRILELGCGNGGDLLSEYFTEGEKRDGVLRVPKDYGMFVSQKK